MVLHLKLLAQLIVAPLALVLAAGPSVAAQKRQVLDDASSGHTISIRSTSRLDFEGLDLAPDLLARVFRLPAGGWGVSDRVFAGVIQLFDSTGAPAGTFGRSGQGPGELGGEVFAVAMRGELWVVDPGNSRLSIFAKDLSYVRDWRLGMHPVIAIAPARDGRSVLVSGSTVQARMYYAVARVSQDAGLDVFGSPLGQHPLPPSQWLVQRRMAAETVGDEVWSVAISGGEIDVLKSSDLSVVAGLQLPGEEMARKAPWSVANFDERPAPRLIGLASDSSGILWVSFGVADRKWKPGLDPREEGVEAVFDTGVLAIDPAKRDIVGAVTLDAICLPVEGNLISCVDEIGQTVRILALQFKSNRRAEP
jgi:hypothetical protein